VEGKSDVTATIEVRSVGRNQCVLWRAIPIPNVQILLDGRVSGVVSEEQVSTLSIPAGISRVTAKNGLFRSRTLVLSLGEGEFAALGCGVRCKAYHLWMLAFFIGVTSTTGLVIGLPKMWFMGDRMGDRNGDTGGAFRRHLSNRIHPRCVVVLEAARGL
jgi:hypothetical protein